MHTFAFHTSDPALARKLHDLITEHGKGPGAHAAEPVVTAPAPVVVAPPAPPPAPVVAPPAPPAAAAPPPPPAPPPAPAASAEEHPDDAKAKAEGWTIEHVRGAAQAFTKKHGNAGPQQLAAILQKYMPDAKKPQIKDLPARYWSGVYNELSAG